MSRRTEAQVAADARAPYARKVMELEARLAALANACAWVLSQADKGALVGQLDLHVIRRALEGVQP